MKNQKRAIKINKYWKDSEVLWGNKPGQYATDIKKIKKQLKKDNNSYKIRSLRWDNIGRAICYIGFTVCAIGILCHAPMFEKPNKTSAESIVEPNEEPPSPITNLTKEQGFTQVAPVTLTTDELFVKYFGADAHLIKAICKAESGLRPNAVGHNKNGTIDQGLCQINSSNIKYYQGQDIFDPEVNIATAKKIYDSQSWFAWTVYKTKAYLKYL